MSQLFQRVIWYNTFLIQAGIDPLCDMLDTEPRAIITLPAQRTHEAAREGVVPLCEDGLWNPRKSLESPHSGLMRQPTKDGPVWNIKNTLRACVLHAIQCQGLIICSDVASALTFWADVQTLSMKFVP